MSTSTSPTRPDAKRGLVIALVELDRILARLGQRAASIGYSEVLGNVQVMRALVVDALADLDATGEMIQ